VTNRAAEGDGYEPVFFSLLGLASIGGEPVSNGQHEELPMNAPRFFRFCFLSTIVALMAHLTSATALTVPSDELRITNPTGTVFDGIIPEVAGSAETSVAFGPASYPPVVLANNGQFVFLLEPPGEPQDPNAPPPVLFFSSLACPSGCPVSDLVIMVPVQTPFGGPGVILVSDTDPGLANLVGQVNQPGFGVSQTLLTETGQLQDLGPFLTGHVQVLSDVVPEPGTLLLLASGLAGLVAAGAHRNRE
jgi:hypothetical protein